MSWIEELGLAVLIIVLAWLLSWLSKSETLTS